MRPDSFGEYMWEGYPTNVNNVRTELMSLWLETLPKPTEKATFSKERNHLVYGSDGSKWGWYLDKSDVRRPYICQAPKAIANQIRSTAKSLFYGSFVHSKMKRGPCFLIQPQDVL